METVYTFIGRSIVHFKKTRFEFQPTKKLKVGEVECTGEATKGRLTIAIGSPLSNWFPVFVHEIGHLFQRERDPKFFDKCDKVFTRLDAWLAGVENNLKWPEVCRLLALEHDCESIALRLIEKHGLPLSPAEYAQKANAYLKSYANTFRNRKWDSAPYSDPKRWKKEPTALLPMKELIKP